jgi:hypothetical protein
VLKRRLWTPIRVKRFFDININGCKMSRIDSSVRNPNKRRPTWSDEKYFHIPKMPKIHKGPVERMNNHSGG